jgi:MFS family permease
VRYATMSTAALAAAVAIAFADSSIVVLALPQLLSEFGTSITGVSWVITAYNAVVAVVTIALGRRLGRARPRVVAATGLVVFLVASIACALAGGLEVLVACRCVQGAGAGLLLTAALPLLVAATGSESRGVNVWIAAGAVGVALGPALGGVLTEAFDWRAIFVVQAPVAALALPAALATTAVVEPVDRPASRRALAANVALALVFAALVGALFLVVVLLVNVWRFSPLEAAAVVTVLPATTIVGGRVERALGGASGAAVGALALAAGLLGLALLPASSVALVAASLALCGAGLGLALPFATRVSLEGGSLAAAGARSIGARHAGLVLALVLVAPLLASEVETAAERAALASAAAVLDAPVGIGDKVSLALALDREIDNAPKGSLPDVDAAFEGREGSGVENLHDELVDTLEATLTRGFRSSFALAALFAVLATVPLLILRRRA